MRKGMWKNGEVKIEKSVLPGKQAELSHFGKREG